MSALSRQDLLALPAVIDLETAGQALGLGRTKAHELARAGDWPTPLLRLGKRYRVPTAPLLELLGIDPAPDMSEGQPASRPVATADACKERHDHGNPARPALSSVAGAADRPRGAARAACSTWAVDDRPVSVRDGR